MKKLFLGSLILVAACCGLAACTVTGDNTTSGTDGTDGYAALNEMLGAHYSQIQLTIETDFGADKLTDSFAIVYGEEVMVTYSLERFLPFDVDHPDVEEKIVKRGSAIIDGESVTVVEGEDIGLSAGIAKLPFSFKKTYFSDATLEGVYLDAGVKDVKGFTGGEYTCTDMKVWAEFLEFFRTIRLTCTDKEGNAVRAEYTFTL